MPVSWACSARDLGWTVQQDALQQTAGASQGEVHPSFICIDEASCKIYMLCRHWLLNLTVNMVQCTGKRAPAEEPREGKAAKTKAAKPKAAGSKATGPSPDQAPGHGSAVPASPSKAPESMLGWQGLGLGPGVTAAIAELGFEEPTPIQRECLLPAIRDRRDVIGAAQTVCPQCEAIVKCNSVSLTHTQHMAGLLQSSQFRAEHLLHKQD